MQRYPDSGPSTTIRRTEGFATAPTGAVGEAKGTNIGNLIDLAWYQGQWASLKEQELKKYLDETIHIPIVDWIWTPTVSTFVFYTHIVLACVAVYFSIRATCGFDGKNFFAALVCPYLYLPYYLSLYGVNKICSTNVRMKKNAAEYAEAD